MDTCQSPIISPLTMRESARGITLTSIYDEMLARRELSVVGDINSAMAHDLCQQIRLLEAADPTAPITVFVSSPGGNVRAGLAIYDTMRLSPCPSTPPAWSLRPLWAPSSLWVATSAAWRPMQNS